MSGWQGGSSSSPSSPKKADELRNKIYIRQEAKQKQDLLVAACPGEVGWFGLVTEHPTGVLVVDDIVVCQQEVTDGSYDATSFGLHSLVEELGPDSARLKYWGHSHGSLSAFFSTIDIDQILDWGTYGIPYIISYVQNKKGESKTRMDMFKPFEFHVPDTQCSLIPLVPNAVNDWVKEQVREKVTIQKKTVQTVMSSHTSSHSEEIDLEEPYKPDGISKGASYTRTIDGIRQDIIAGKIRCQEDMDTGKRVTFYYSDANDEDKITGRTITGRDRKPIIDGSDQQKVIEQGRSVTRSEEKRAEGKVGAPQDGAESQVKPLQIPKASDLKNDSGEGNKNSQLKLLPERSTTHEEVVGVNADSEDQFIGGIEEEKINVDMYDSAYADDEWFTAGLLRAWFGED